MPATREARAELAPRPIASAACTCMRPARQAGSAVAAATTSSAISSETASRPALGAPAEGAPSESAKLPASLSPITAPAARPRGAASAVSSR